MRIRSRRVVLPDGVRPATIRIEDGTFVEIGEGTADEDFGDLVVMPGLVDSHVHVNEPGRTEWEGFSTATRAALAGGTTTVVDMPLNSIPPTVDPAGLEEKRRAAAPQVTVDVAFWGGVVPGSVGHVAELAAAGVCGFKVFTVDSGVAEFPPLDPDGMAAAATAVAATGLPLLVHAEDPGLLRPPSGDPRSYANYLDSRPPQAEARAIEKCVAATDPASTRLHILHVAGAEAVEALVGTSDRVTAETCPHYLTFAAEDIPDGATAFKCAPPIRSREHRERLWEGLLEGTMQMVVSDHSPAPPALKRVAEGDLMAAWGGIASLELRLPAVWNGARRRGIDLERVVEWLAEAPARLAGLGHRKGRIAVGYDADLTVFDPDDETIVSGTSLHQRHSLTPYDGMRLAGRVREVVLAGEVTGGAGDPERGKLLRSGH
ncbi:MAG TPA: allantoinase AllB [Acidimicrobiia bacterium]|nr:allantoinase AllB [Acidimicrobiia bacterium]